MNLFLQSATSHCEPLRPTVMVLILLGSSSALMTLVCLEGEESLEENLGDVSANWPGKAGEEGMASTLFDLTGDETLPILEEGNGVG